MIGRQPIKGTWVSQTPQRAPGAQLCSETLEKWCIHLRIITPTGLESWDINTPTPGRPLVEGCSRGGNSLAC